MTRQLIADLERLASEDWRGNKPAHIDIARRALDALKASALAVEAALAQPEIIAREIEAEMPKFGNAVASAALDRAARIARSHAASAQHATPTGHDMSVDSAPYYWLVCDHCGVTSTQDSEFSAYSDLDGAVIAAEDSGWIIDHAPSGDEVTVCDDCGIGIPDPDDEEEATP